MATLTGSGFSMFGGGPFYRLAERLGLVRPSGTLRITWLVAFTWLPIVIGATLRLAFGVPLDPIMRDISVHARFLVALPLLLISTALLEKQTRGAVRVIYEARLADPTALDVMFSRVERLRCHGGVEVGLAIAALAIGQLGLWGVLAPSGVFAGIEQAPGLSFARIWYDTLAFPLWQFLSLRWMWRWIVWCYLLVRLSRLPLEGTAAHPDHAAGLGCLAWPLAGYAWYVAAFASVLAGAWSTQLIDHRVTVPSLGPTALVLLVGAVIAGYAPLLVFTPQLYALKRRDLANNTLMGFDYMRRFDTKWVPSPRAPEFLGSQDIQALNDLGGAFQVVLTTRLTVFELGRMKNIVIAVLLPMFPLIATVIPLQSVIPRLARVFLG